jgi:hypothetical protein
VLNPLVPVSEVQLATQTGNYMIRETRQLWKKKIVGVKQRIQNSIKTNPKEKIVRI